MTYSEYASPVRDTHRQGAYRTLKVVLIFLVFIVIGTAGADTNKARVTTDFSHISVPVFTVETHKDFDDVIEDLLVIIAEHNFRLTQQSRIGKAIAKRYNIPFPSATVIHFCNLEYARQLLQSAPDYLAKMPCRVAVMPNENSSTTIQVWLLPENDQRTEELAKRINAILKDIVTFAAS